MFIHHLFIFFDITMKFGFWVVSLQIVQYLKQKTVVSQHPALIPALFKCKHSEINTHEAT